MNEDLLRQLVTRLRDVERRLSIVETIEPAGSYTRLKLVDGITAPSTASGFALIYVDTADGDLKVKFGDGTTKTISADT